MPMELFAREIRPTGATKQSLTGRRHHRHQRQIDHHGTLIGHILAVGLRLHAGSRQLRNIGKPVLDLAAPNGRTVYVLEVSSYPGRSVAGPGA